MTIEIIDIGNHVECDLCSEDFTNREDKGGFLFGSKAVCPICTPSFLKKVKSYNEDQFIKAECPAGMSFRNWVLSLRNGNNQIRIYSGEDFRL